jgi:sterol desaturase/sphingolipid hydroxylase (fatty acid hydroxylase superfamily)
VAANIIIGASALLVHANVWWNFGFVQNLFVSPLFHQWHHACVDDESRDHIGNYGAALSIWDRLFGTWSLPALKRPAGFGVEDGPRATLLDLVVHPLRVCCNLACKLNSQAPRQTQATNDSSRISR